MNGTSASLTNSSTPTTVAFTNSTISSSATFAKVLVHNGTSVSQSEINQFLANGTILGTINVGSDTTIFNGNDTFNVASFSASGSLTIVIGAQGISGPRVLLVNISKDSFLDIQSGYLAVTLDNRTVTEAASLQAVLTGSGTPSFILLGTSSGFQLLLSIPHFSTHTIIITTPKPSSQTATSNSGELTSYIIGGIVVIAIVLAAVFVIRNQRGKTVVASGPSA
jgi:hypothetical protein